jgi:DNA-binding transcriptional LysR family regulator
MVMIRNLDIAALRALVAIADTGGVTRAAGALNLTQSAVSMQIRRLEEFLGIVLLDRAGRGVALTGAGETLLAEARRMIALNDEVIGRLTHVDHAGELTLGVPHDIVYPAIPRVLQQFARDWPRMRLQLVSSFTRGLREDFSRGALNMILTTEDDLGPGGEMLVELPLVWVGAPGGQAWLRRPLPLAYERRCIFRAGVQQALERADIPWTMAVEGDSSRVIEASVAADLTVHTLLSGTVPATLAAIDHGGALPPLRGKKVALYMLPGSAAPVQALRAMLVQTFGAMAPTRRIDSAA